MTRMVQVALAEDVTEAEELDLLSLAPRHELESFAERLILPCGFYLLAFTRDLNRIPAAGQPDRLAGEPGSFGHSRR